MQGLVSSNIFWPLPVSVSNLHMRYNSRNNAMLGQFKCLLTSSCQFDCITYKMQNQKPCTAWSAHVRWSIRNSGMLSQFKSLNYDDWNWKIGNCYAWCSVNSISYPHTPSCLFQHLTHEMQNQELSESESEPCNARSVWASYDQDAKSGTVQCAMLN